MSGSNADVALPEPLSPSDAVAIRRIMALQDRGNLTEAGQLVANLENPILMGTILAQRYLGRFHRSTMRELGDWLTLYADLPDAPAVHALFLKRRPPGVSPGAAFGASLGAALGAASWTTTPPRPISGQPPASPDREAGADDLDADIWPFPRNASLDRAIIERARAGETKAALRLIAEIRRPDRSYAGLLRAEVARELFFRNEDAEALRVALMAMRDVPRANQIALAGHIGGLAAWRMGWKTQARGLFEQAAQAGLASGRDRAAAAFWAARANRAIGDWRAEEAWLHRSAAEPRTLHGLLARHALGQETGIASSNALLTPADLDAVAATAGGWRAFALLQVGQHQRAEEELRGLWPRLREDRIFARSLLLVASATGSRDFAARIAGLMRDGADNARGDMWFAVPTLRPTGGFTVDPALIYALTRLESNFDTQAVSPAGARGLMQIMPVTAQYVSGDSDLGNVRLHEPALNLRLGQKYLHYLASVNAVGNDLLRVLASYNTGPSNFLRRTGNLRDMGDPLLFIEAIPVPETRAFVVRALTYTWLYAARLHLPAPSLEALADGVFPPFTLARPERKIRPVTSLDN